MEKVRALTKQEVDNMSCRELVTVVRSVSGYQATAHDMEIKEQCKLIVKHMTQGRSQDFRDIVVHMWGTRSQVIRDSITKAMTQEEKESLWESYDEEQAFMWATTDYIDVARGVL